MKTIAKLSTKISVSGVLALLVSLPVYAAPLNIGNVPLYLTAKADPNVLLNMSVETPMGGAAYNDQSEGVSAPSECTGRKDNFGGDNNADDIGTCYVETREYIGYFDPKKCYVYSSNRFNPSSAANANHECSGKWSGNFLNWATMTAIDMFIMTMTGGNRATDTTSETVLRRSRRQDNDSWFPRKVIDSSTNIAPSKVTPYTDSTLFIEQTSWTIKIGETFTAATTGSPSSKYKGEFNVDVKVCDSSIGLETNCIGYPSSSPTYYKPEGLIQRHALTKRFAVMGYTNDDNQSRWGGVLRAPMKYTGPTMPDGVGGTQANPDKEWGTDGLLIANPNPVTGFSQSGVVNYLNKFSTPGYKSYDPIGELFYESIRYFKKLGPTPEAFSGISPMNSGNALTGGFPIYTTWTDPIQYDCQKNFIIAVNDANPWLDKQLPGTFFNTSNLTCAGTTCSLKGAGGTMYTLTANDYGPPSNADTAIDVTALTNNIGVLEGLNSAGVWTNSGTWTSGTQTGAIDSVGGGKDTFDNSCSDKSGKAMKLGEVMGTCGYPGKQNTYYIAGLAHYANITDLRTDIAKKQNVSSFFIDTQEFNTNPLDGPKNMLWLAGKYGGFIDDNNDTIPQASEWDSDSNGLPDNYVYATQPAALVSGLNSAFVDIDNRDSTAAAVALNSSTISSETRVYQAQFSTATWSGDLFAYAIDANGNVASTKSWLASGHVPLWSNRVIFTRNGTTGGQGVQFLWPSNPGAPTVSEITTAQVALLKTGGVTDTVGSQRLDYLRGNTALEPGTFRSRSGAKLGDIINSAPIHVGKPNFLPDSIELSSPHTDFRVSINSLNSNTGRLPVVYAGSNDGMMHGFNAATGDEVFAYVPYSVYTDLYRLTMPGYSHRYYVDGQPTVGDAFGDFGTRCSPSPCWRTVLIGSLAGGGKGIFALDVTNPANFVKNDAKAKDASLWEYTSTNDADLGFTYGQPTIAKMQDGTWRAIFGNGYNSTNEKAVLFMVNIADTTDVVKIVLDNTVGGGNGLSTPSAIDADGDYVADYIYAGDLNGNIWKVDVTSSTKTDWWSYYVVGGVKTTPKPLFVAKNEAGTARQAITSRLEIGNHPNGQSGYMVYFGTGLYLQDVDRTNTTTQTFYGIWDKSLANPTTVSTASAVARALLLPQTISTDTTPGGITVRKITNDTILKWGDAAACSAGSGECMGWKVDLPTSGERVITDSMLIASGLPPRILFSTTIPSNIPCSFGGDSWIMEISPSNGGSLTGLVFDVNNDGVFDDKDLITGGGTPAGVHTNSGLLSSPRVLHGGSQNIPGKLHKYFGSTEGTIAHETNTSTQKPSRQSWRQLR